MPGNVSIRLFAALCRLSPAAACRTLDPCCCTSVQPTLQTVDDSVAFDSVGLVYRGCAAWFAVGSGRLLMPSRPAAACVRGPAHCRCAAPCKPR